MPTTRPHPGTLERLGAWAARRRRLVVSAWVVVVVGLGGLAPFADGALSGAGWEAPGSESVQAREALESALPGRGTYALPVVVSADAGGRTLQRAVGHVSAVLRDDSAVAGVTLPRAGATLSPDGRTAVVVGRAGAPPSEMVDAAGRLGPPLADLSAPGVSVRLTGTSALWSNFNAANKQAMLQAEALSWPITLVLLVVAFGTLAAAGLPLLLTFAGLLGSGGLLFVAGQVADVSIWAMNFSMMFAIALGIDYALFLVVRFRAALASGLEPAEASAVTTATAGKAVLASGLTVMAALLAVTLVPVPAFRSVPLGIVLAVGMVLAATLTLLPAVLAGLGHRINRGRLRIGSAVEHTSPRYAAWAARLWSRPVPYGAAALAILLLLAAPVAGLQTGMPASSIVPEDATSRQGDALLARAFGPAVSGRLDVVTDADSAGNVSVALGTHPGIAAVAPPERAGDLVLLSAIPTDPAGTERLKTTIDDLRRRLPTEALIGGAAAENLDVERALVSRLPLVVAVVVGLAFAVLVVLLRAPLAAAAAVVLNLLATAAAFGIARLVFQEGMLDEVLGFTSQGFVDAWAPIFFFALVFALAMDYTVFLLAGVREARERTGDARQALVDGMASSGRVINAAAGVMVAVFLTFAAAGTLPVKEMGAILAVAVLLDATLVRLLLQPVVMRLLGERAWWMPRWLDRLLPDVRLAHGGPREVAAPA